MDDRRAPTERAGFTAMVDLVRSNARAAVYDERLVTRRVPDRIAQFVSQSSSGAGRSEAASAAGMDLLAHLLAMWLTAGSRESPT